MQNIALLVFSLEYIEKHLHESIKTMDIANACHCSKSTLEKLFQCVNSISVHDYIVRRRMMVAAKRIAEHPEESILLIALEYGYSSHEAFARAFKEIWDCNPSEFRNRRYMEIFPRLREPIQKGDMYVSERKNVDISELYDLFNQRKNCYFVCADIKHMVDFNEISRKAGDLAILTAMERMNQATSENDMVFRIGGDEFCILTDNQSAEYAENIAKLIKNQNGDTFLYEGQQIPLNLHVVTAKFQGSILKYDELFSELHMVIAGGKDYLLESEMDS